MRQSLKQTRYVIVNSKQIFLKSPFWLKSPNGRDVTERPLKDVNYKMLIKRC